MVGKRISLEKNLLNTSKQELSANLERTALCSFFAMGKCLRGKECKFAHDMTQIRPKPDLTRTSLCHDFMRKGSCKSGNKCKYAHGEAQLRAPKGEQKKPLAAAPAAAVVEPLLWDPMGLELEAPQGLKEPLAPMDALIPVLQRLMGKRQTRPKSPQSPPTPVLEAGRGRKASEPHHKARSHSALSSFLCWRSPSLDRKSRRKSTLATKELLGNLGKAG